MKLQKEPLLMDGLTYVDTLDSSLYHTNAAEVYNGLDEASKRSLRVAIESSGDATNPIFVGMHSAVLSPPPGSTADAVHTCRSLALGCMLSETQSEQP